ncbi:hypothetical protein P3G55_20440 [Leptospira sp. 96542]|nr:hypothetical protein [Leptospira sp. 96542]
MKSWKALLVLNALLCIYEQASEWGAPISYTSYNRFIVYITNSA